MHKVHFGALIAFRGMCKALGNLFEQPGLQVYEKIKVLLSKSVAMIQTTLHTTARQRGSVVTPLSTIDEQCFLTL